MIKMFRDLESFEKFNGSVEGYKEFVKDLDFVLIFDEDEENFILVLEGVMYFVVGGYEDMLFVKMDEDESVEYKKKYNL